MRLFSSRTKSSRATEMESSRGRETETEKVNQRDRARERRLIKETEPEREG
jgi:hypothetical protein